MIKTEKRAEKVLRYCEGTGFLPAEKDAIPNILYPGTRPFILKDGEILHISPILEWAKIGEEIRILTATGSEYILPDIY